MTTPNQPSKLRTKQLSTVPTPSATSSKPSTTMMDDLLTSSEPLTSLIQKIDELTTGSSVTTKDAQLLALHRYLAEALVTNGENLRPKIQEVAVEWWHRQGYGELDVTELHELPQQEVVIED